MIINIDVYDNGCTISYSTTNTPSTPMPMMTTNQVRLVGTDSEIIAKLTTVLSDLRAASEE